MTFKELKEMEDYKLADLIDVINEDGEELDINNITDETEIITWNKSLDSTCIEVMVKNYAMGEYSLTELVEELSKQVGFDSNRIWIGRNSYDEYEMEIDGELWSNCYTYGELETAIRCLFKGMELNKKTEVDYINNYIKQKIDYLEDLASIETNEGRWREEEKYLYAISILEEIVEYINMNGGGEDEDSN